LYFDSFGAARPKATVDICICTFRRPQLAAALGSIARQRNIDGVELRVIVADNDETPSARALVETTAAAAGLQLTYLHAPARNISIARNACLNEARAEWIAFLDDDEIADPLWLSRLVTAAKCGGWDAVLGPVQAIYRREASDWVRRADFHSSGAIWVRGVIQTGHTSNVLIRRSAIGPLRFELAFGRTGGEDIDFFYRFYDRGGRIGFAPEAWVQDPVPQEREQFRWVAVRWFRFGQTHAERVLSQTRTPADRALAVLTTSAKVGIYAAAALLALPFEVLRIKAAIRAVMHAGAVARLLGKRLVELYGDNVGASGPAPGDAVLATGPERQPSRRSL
jgi:succinoglycan biosynthesis protein ExoM